MSKTKIDLIKCFQTIFPSIPVDEITRISTSSFPEWDSVANIQLTCIIEEIFEIELDDEILESLTSFTQILRYLENKNG